MIRYSKWLARTRAVRRMRLTTPIGVLLACVLFAGLPAVASASSPEMRGEWELVISSSGGPPAKGIALIRTEANGSGEFAASDVLFEHLFPGTFSGKLEGSKASIEVTTAAYGPIPAAVFTSTAITVESTDGSLSLSGPGTLVSGTTPVPDASILATRIKTYAEVEAREAKEMRELEEHEEQEARENIRGEWSLVVKAGPQTLNGTAIVKTEANAENAFASSSALFEGVDPSTFSGTLEHGKATVEVTTEPYGPLPAGKFASKTMTVESNDDSLSLSGSGELTSGTTTIPGATLVATRTKTYAEVTAREAKEKTEREAKEQTEREAKEKLEREAKEKAEREAKETEAKAKAEQEAKAKAEQEAKAKDEQEAKAKAQQKAALSKTALTSVQLTGKTFAVSAAGLLSLQVTNPNPYAISGRITLVLDQSTKAGKTSSAHSDASKKALSLGTVSFGISPDGKQLVKLELSKGGRDELTRHKTLHALATVLTKASGQTSTTKTLTLTLQAGKAKQSKS